MTDYRSFEGTIIQIENSWSEDFSKVGCNHTLSVVGTNGDMVNFTTTPDTYILNHTLLEVGDQVIGFYDGNAPVPLIFPPQYRALVIGKVERNEFITFDYFDRQLINSDGTLKLNISPYTNIILTNGQSFTGSPANKNLVVVYSITTRSIPAQTSPHQVVVVCDE